MAESEEELKSLLMKVKEFVVSPDGGAISCLQLKVSCSYVTVAKQKRSGKTDLLQEMHSQKPLQHLTSHFIAQNRTTCLPLRHIINKGTEVAMMDVPAYPTSGYFWKRRRVPSLWMAWKTTARTIATTILPSA
ncbi:unnamed protein product [Rangifer tarandus platyrhynchus]|uniref:Uncharacterized protein n=2 Tax=Rangifer tarandus platyrhynchus TaxID=3082113 RepID=A0ABN8ZPX6_RANTA|nr:unnamed protein product [Rangifer tarandus platyrhynchus]